MLSRFAVAISFTTLVACATQSPSDDAAEGDAALPEADVPLEEVVYPERAFPDDSFHALLLAEFALRRQAYEVTFNNYIEQAPLLRDPGVSAHATHLAQFFNRDQSVLENAELWVELEPQNLEARATYARQLVKLGRNAEALPHLVAIERENGTANFALVTNNFPGLSADVQNSLFKSINALAEEFPDNVSLLFTQALIYSEMNKPQEALAALDALFALEPEQTQGLLLEARILSILEADNPYARIQDVLAKQPDDRGLRMRYARLLAASDLTAAREQFEILSAQAPEDGDLLFSLALLNREIGDPITASAYLRQLISLDKRVDEAHYYLGLIEEERNQTEDALLHYKAVSAGREYLAASSRIGELLLKSRQLERSQTWFAEERKKNPELAGQLYGLEADLLQRNGMSEAAAKTLDAGLAALPEDSNLLYARAMLREQRGDLQRMETDLRDIIARDPNNATALNALGYTLADHTDRYEEALALISRALELEPNEPAILDSMGWVLYQMGRPDEALVYLQRAHQQFPDPEVAAHFGEVLWVTGNTEGALEVWRAANARDPSHAVLRATLKRLNIQSLAPPAMEDRPGNQQKPLDGS
jgi:tetratricopeptide (TPR) repeat protein